MSVVSAPTYEFTVEEHQRRREADIFHEDDRIELKNGVNGKWEFSRRRLK